MGSGRCRGAEVPTHESRQRCRSRALTGRSELPVGLKIHQYEEVSFHELESQTQFTMSSGSNELLSTY